MFAVAFKTTLALAKGKSKIKKKNIMEEILNTFDPNNKL
jgi:hypothetical protein